LFEHRGSRPGLRHQLPGPDAAELTSLDRRPVRRDVQGAYVIGNIAATFTPAKGNWSCGVFVNNVANSVIKEFTTHTNFKRRAPGIVLARSGCTILSLWGIHFWQIAAHTYY
jgi:hypothetical protein